MALKTGTVSISFDGTTYTPKWVKTPCGQYFPDVLDWGEALTANRRNFTNNTYRSFPAAKKEEYKNLTEEVNKVIHCMYCWIVLFTCCPLSKYQQ